MAKSERPADAATAAKLAAWRREGRGLWHIVYVIEGYDEEQQIILPGKFSRRFAVGLGRVILSKDLGVARKFIHLQGAERET